jgi:hypothetical protein
VVRVAEHSRGGLHRREAGHAAESEQAIRRGWDEPPRTWLRREVCTAAAGARTETEFFASLGRAGVLVRRRHSTLSPGEVTGYAVGMPGHTGKDGQAVWYGGGKLAADLTLPKLRARWGDPAVRDPLAGAANLPAPVIRGVLRATVAQAAAESFGEAEFFARLRGSGLLVRERFSEINPGEVTGYAVSLRGHAGTDGAPRWYGGGRLHDSLTLPRLRARWTGGEGGTGERSGVFRITAPERADFYRHAARQAAVAAEQLRRCAAGDPGSGADAAWAAADTLRAAARVTGSRVLRCAADGYDRAARAPHRQIPGRSPEGMGCGPRRGCWRSLATPAGMAWARRVRWPETWSHWWTPWLSCGWRMRMSLRRRRPGRPQSRCMRRSAGHGTGFRAPAVQTLRRPGRVAGLTPSSLCR